MADFYVPSGVGEFELVEKKSRFLAQVWPVTSEEEAKACIEARRKQYHDARHHCFCYCIDERLLRYGDDGEPQGSAGQPMLNVLTQEKIQQACCVVTRYFGGTLLGTGGLVRAYSHATKGALEKAGRSTYETLQEFSVIAPYGLFETVQKVTQEMGGILVESNYTADVEMKIQVDLAESQRFLTVLTDQTSGQILAEETEQVLQLVPVESF